MKRLARQPLLPLLAAMVLLAAGCSVEYSRKPSTELLEQKLTQQHSNKQDVLDVLGAPRGYGVISLPQFEGPPRAIWYYEYGHLQNGTYSMTLLLVFFDREKYDGYIWYASKEKFVEQK